MSDFTVGGTIYFQNVQFGILPVLLNLMRLQIGKLLGKICPHFLIHPVVFDVSRLFFSRKIRFVNYIVGLI